MAPEGEPARRSAPSDEGTVAGDGREREDATLTEHEDTVELPRQAPPFAPGAVLGGRYRLHSQLGRGGMGEVWRAFDLKLRVEVALKALLPDRFRDERRRAMLRREVRAAREVISPNVCRIFDLVEADGTELVSMEYVDGATLIDLLRERGPLDLKQAQDIASQLLAGLEAIHAAGLIHRDIKPENVMITRTGRVVVMDFGLARGESDGSGSVAGTPAYMAPEQARGGTLDARADLFAAGVVLAEMVSPAGVEDADRRRRLWTGVRAEPVELPDSPWSAVIAKAVARSREARYGSARALTRALEEVTLRVVGADDLTPYPGLSSFTEADADCFFGREAEIERLWRRLESTHLVALVGPSGAGKSSFIAAGLVAHAPLGWGILRSSPGDAATSSLARVVARELAGDPEAVELLPSFADPAVAVELLARWRGRHDRALLIVDQFEELFTQNPAAEQRRFAELLERLVLEADLRVLVSMRDDFLLTCRLHEPLLPLFESLVPLMPPMGPALRRALVQPARTCGYDFEDDGLVEEMLAEVEDERGALPLLAFAMSRLWEARDRDAGLLTREAYADIGGVGGALAQHAEATLEEIGAERLVLVRELFRNLVTADDTRAVRRWDELLTVFDRARRAAANEVLGALVDARLLTSYEVRDENGEASRQVEIIHESLLTAWPRLVRWRTQDEDGARFRDELRQAARSWHEHGRHQDRLWTGSAVAELELWRERYPGGLSELEEAFTRATTELAGRRRRRRRVAVAAAFAVLLAVLTVVGIAWRRSALAARRAEAHRVITLGELQLINLGVTASLAHAIKSLELVDTEEGRLLALKALWRLPPPQILLDAGSAHAFAPDGDRLVIGHSKLLLQLWDSLSGEPIVLEPDAPSEETVRWMQFSADQRLVFSSTGSPGTGAQMWSVDQGKLLRRFDCGGKGTRAFLSDDGQRLVTATLEGDGFRETLRTWPLPEGEPTVHGHLPAGGWSVDPTGRRVGFNDGPVPRLLDLSAVGGLGDTTETTGGNRIVSTVFDRSAPRIATAHESGATRVWSLETTPPSLIRTMQSVKSGQHALVGFSPDGSWLAARINSAVVLHDLERPQEAMPLVLGFGGKLDGAAFDPQGRWLAMVGWTLTRFVALDRRYPSVMEGHQRTAIFLAFAPDGRWLASASHDQTVRLWPVPGVSGLQPRVLHTFADQDGPVYCLAVAPDGSFLVTGTEGGGVWVVPVDGEQPRLIGRLNDSVQTVAVSPDGETIAAGGASEDGLIHLWHLASGRHRSIDPGEDSYVNALEFLADGHLVSATGASVRRWNLENDTSEVLLDHGAWRFDIDRDGTGILVRSDGPWVEHLSLVDGRVLPLPELGDNVRSVALDPTGTIAVTGDNGGPLRVGRVGSEPHLLYAALENDVRSVAVSPDGRWIAASGKVGDGFAVYLWPMPDLDRPPLHTLPREALIDTLKALTNVRIVRDEDSPSEWGFGRDPFPGWDTVPTW